MTELEALKEHFSEEQFFKEPLAMCVMFYLKRNDPEAYSQILQMFNQTMESRFKRYIEEEIDNDEATHVP